MVRLSVVSIIRQRGAKNKTIGYKTTKKINWLKHVLTCRCLRLCTSACIHVHPAQVALGLELAAEAAELALLHVFSELTDNLLSDRDGGHLAAAIVALFVLVPTCAMKMR